MGHDASIITPDRESIEPSLIAKLISLPVRIPGVLRINRQIAAGSYDIVHLHFANSGWMADLGGYKYVVHCHGSDVRKGLHQGGRAQLVRHTLRRAEHVFYVTPDLYPLLAPIRPDATLLPNPIDTVCFSPRSGYTCNENLRVLLAVPLHHLKGPRIAHQAARSVIYHFPHLNVDFFAFSFGTHAQHYADCLSDPAITYVEPRPRSEMAALYQGFDIVVGQMVLGAMGATELEAMSCGKPVICFCDLASYEQAYGSPPPVLSANTAEGVVKCLCDLITDTEKRSQLGQAARDWVVKHHEIGTIVNRLVVQYERVLAARSHHNKIS
jgi:glycosyltransferase involved in cell wall biosynthesis